MADINLGVGAANSASDAYEIANSCKFNKAGSETMYRPNTNGNRRTWTSSFWIKFCGGTGSGTDTHMLYHGAYGQGTRMFTSGGTDQLYIDLCGYGDERYRWITNQVFRDRSAWYHIIWRVDTTQSSLGDRMRLYVNGEQITDWQKEADDADNDASNSGNKMPQNYDTLANLDHSGYDAMQFSYKEASIYCDMYLAEFHHCDGYSYGPTEFGKFDSNGIWVPIEANVSYGNNGCYLDFETSSNLGNDANGGTDFTLQNIAAADQATDTPTNNFCTMNSIFKTNDNFVVSEGQTKVTCGSGTGWLSNVGTVALTKGKWYWELASVTSVYEMFGIADASDDKIPQAAGGYYLGYGSNDTTLSIGMYMLNGTFYGNQDGGSGVGIAPGAVGDIYGVALDLDNLGFYITRNGVSPTGSDPSSGSSLTGAATWNDSIYSGYYYPAVSVFQGNGLEMNFGGYTSNPIASAATDANGYGSFEYAPPAGYYAICTKNLAEYG